MVAAQLEKSDYQPGDEVTASVQVNTASGDPVGGAGVTLFAVDQGVLDLTGYQPPDLHAYFYTPKPLRVSTSTSIPFMRSEDPGQVRFANKGQIIGGGGLGKIRQKFQAVAFWSADIKTDIHGRVQAVFKAPDSLTCYRLFAVVHHGARFGMGKTAFRVYRPLMVESALPRFGRVGDKVIAKAIIFNQSAKPLNVVARLELDDLLQSERPTERRITVPAAGQVDVRFPIQFVAQGRSRTVWRVRSEKQVALQDARKSWIDIRPVMPMRDIHHFVRTTGPMLDILGKIPEELREAEGALEISVSTSPMAGLEEASEYLLDYPHGCAEQTSSRLIPWLLLEKHGDLFPRLQMPKGRSAADPVTHGINRLLSMQTHDGGLSYWPAGRADPFASAYGGMVLAIARLQGKTVPVGSLDALATYLNKQARALPKDAYHWGMHCLSLYTLTLLDCPQPSLHERAFQERENIPADARALLAAAVRQVGGPDAMVQSLLKQSGTKAGAFAYYGNENQQQAMRLMAVAGSAEAAVLVDRLIHSTRRGHWGSTFANAWTLLGMAAVEKRGSAHRIACEIFDGKNHHQIRLDSNQRKVTVRLTDIKGPVSFTGPAGQPVFIGVKARLRPTKVASEPIARGMQLKRTYQSLTRPGSEEWQVGDLVRVRLALTVEPDAVHWVALEDGLPAVLEPVLGDLLTQQTGENLAQSWRVNHHILQKDRAVFYMNRLPRGVHNVEYLARVRSEGEVALPPGQAQAMYDPDVVALTIGGRREAKRPHD